MVEKYCLQWLKSTVYNGKKAFFTMHKSKKKRSIVYIVNSTIQPL